MPSHHAHEASLQWLAAAAPSALARRSYPALLAENDPGWPVPEAGRASLREHHEIQDVPTPLDFLAVFGTIVELRWWLDEVWRYPAEV